MKEIETVMQLEEMHNHIDGIDVVSCSYQEALNLKKVAYAQAEISFKAGIQEVVDYLVSDDNGLRIELKGEKWGKKLKEWGVTPH